VTSGDVHFEVSFPSNPKERFRFDCKMLDKPRGFTLKQSLDNDWRLFDMVSFDEMKSQKVQELAQKNELSEPIIPDINSKQTLPEVPKNTVVVAAASSITITPIVVKPKVQLVLSEISIQKIFDKTGSSGVDQVYTIQQNGKADTIALFIPTLKMTEVKQSAALRVVNDKSAVAGRYISKLWARIQFPQMKIL
jgi:hypothetical protein